MSVDDWSGVGVKNKKRITFNTIKLGARVSNAKRVGGGANCDLGGVVSAADCFYLPNVFLRHQATFLDIYSDESGFTNYHFV